MPAGGRIAADGAAEELLAAAEMLASHDLELPAGLRLDLIERRPRPAGPAAAPAPAA